MAEADGPDLRAVAHVVVQERDGSQHREPVLAQRTSTPGLVVTPEFIGGSFTGDWVVTHTSSGLRVPVNTWGGLNIDEAERVAQELGKLPIDWTGDKDAVRADLKAQMPAVKEAIHWGQYPPAKPDSDDDPKPGADELAPYPRTDEQATADALARHITRGLQYRCKETWKLVGLRPRGQAGDGRIPAPRRRVRR